MSVIAARLRTALPRLLPGPAGDPVTPRSLPEWLLLPGAGLFAASLAGFVLLAGTDAYDFAVYLMGGQAWRDGAPVYDQQVLSVWGAGYFTYPPVTLLLFGPLSSLPPAIAYGLAFLVEIGAVLATVWLALALLGIRPGAGRTGAVLAGAAVALWLQPIFDSVHEGKLELVLMVLVLADLAGERHRRWPAGVLIGLATALKITPGIFIVFLLATRRYRAAGTAALTWAGLTALGFAVAPEDSVRFWWQGTFADADRVASPLTVDSVFNQSLHGVTVRLLGAGAGGLWYLVVALVVAAGMAVAVAATRRWGTLAGLLATAVTGLLISPVSWHEHWIWVVPGLALLAWLGLRGRRRSRLLGAAVPGLTGLVFLAWPMPTGEPGRWEPASLLSPASHLWFDEGSRHPAVALAGAAYVLVGLGWLAVAGGALARPAGSAGEARLGVPQPGEGPLPSQHGQRLE